MSIAKNSRPPSAFGIPRRLQPVLRSQFARVQNVGLQPRRRRPLRHALGLSEGRRDGAQRQALHRLLPESERRLLLAHLAKGRSAKGQRALNARARLSVASRVQPSAGRVHPAATLHLSIAGLGPPSSTLGQRRASFGNRETTRVEREVRPRQPGPRHDQRTATHVHREARSCPSKATLCPSVVTRDQHKTRLGKQRTTPGERRVRRCRREVRRDQQHRCAANDE